MISLLPSLCQYLVTCLGGSAWTRHYQYCEDVSAIQSSTDSRLDYNVRVMICALCYFFPILPHTNLGQFGKVYKALLQQGMEPVPVAVKTTKKTSSELEMASFMREMTIMSGMMHPNIVRLYGLVHDGKI